MKSRSSGGKRAVVREVFPTFLRLGLTSFGGPIAHLGVLPPHLRRASGGGSTKPTYARIVAFCSVLPGPTSSQVGMLIGLHARRARSARSLAWLGFTAPSAIAMTGSRPRSAAPSGTRSRRGSRGLLDGLFAAAAAVVAQAVIGLAGSLCTDRADEDDRASRRVLVTLALRPFPGPAVGARSRSGRRGSGAAHGARAAPRRAADPRSSRRSRRRRRRVRRARRVHVASRSAMTGVPRDAGPRRRARLRRRPRRAAAAAEHDPRPADRARRTSSPATARCKRCRDRSTRSRRSSATRTSRRCTGSPARSSRPC